MKIKELIIILIALLIQGCATKLPPKVAVPEHAKIGVMLLIDENPKLVHVGTTVFNNFEKDNVSTWDIKSRIQEYLNSELRRHQVVYIEPSEKLLSNRLKFTYVTWNSSAKYLNEELIPEINAVTKSSDIDFLVTIAPCNLPVEYRSKVLANGYGLFTRCIFGMCRAEALSHFTTKVYAMNQPRLLSWSEAEKSNLSVEISSYDDLKNLPPSEIDKAKELVISYLYKDIRSALERADLK